MWRWSARYLIRASLRRPPSYVTKVHTENLAVASSSAGGFPKRVFRIDPCCQNSRFFSQVSDSIDHRNEKESESPDSERNEAFGGDACSDSHESGFSSVSFEDGSGKSEDFGENSMFSIRESEGLSGVFGDGIEVNNVLERDPFSVSDEAFDPSERLVDEMDSRDVGDEGSNVDIDRVDVAQVENVLSILQSSLDKPLESSLDELDLMLNEEFVVRVLQTPLVPGDNLLGFVKWASNRPDFSLTTRVLECLVRAIGISCRKKDVYALWDLIKEIGEKGGSLITTDMLNDLISMFWKLGKGKAGLEAFNKFEDLGCVRNADTYYLTMEALFSRSLYDDAWSICERLLQSGNLPSDEKIGHIISGFCKGNRAKEAHLVYLMAKDKGKCPSKISINFLISQLCGHEATVLLAMELLDHFSEMDRRRAIKPFSAVLRGLCKFDKVEEAKKLLSEMIESGPPPGNAAFNSVVTGFSKARDMEEAMTVKNMMLSRGLRPDVFTYSVIMSGYANGGQMDDAYKVFSEAKKVHTKLCPVTYHILIRGYCKLEMFEKALELLREMKEYGVQPNHDEYNKLIQSLCLKALDWHTAEALLEEMKQNGLFLNGITRGLIKAVKDLENEALQGETATAEA